MTLGMVTVSAHNTSFLDSYIALIHLTDGEVVWSNSLRLSNNPADRGIYAGGWSRMVLYHFPDRNTPRK